MNKKYCIVPSEDLTIELMNAMRMTGMNITYKSIRRSVDGLEALLKFPEDKKPRLLVLGMYPEYTHEEILPILATATWTGE